MVILILIVLGVCLGSFVNAFVWRLREQAELQDEISLLNTTKLTPASKKHADLTAKRKKLSITRGRSMCTHCGHMLAAKDLVPIASYVLLRGRCRYCKQRIQDTPFAELLTPALFVVFYLCWPFGFSGAGLISFCFWLVFLVGFVALTLYDIRWYELPHRIVLPLIALAVVQMVVISLLFDTIHGGGWNHVRESLLGALIGGGVFYALYKISPKQKLEDGTEISTWIGGGDITLGMLLGLLVGGPVKALLLIFVASLLGTLVAIPLLVSGRANRGSHLPFGPYLMAAAIIVLLFGSQVVRWYFDLLI